MKLKYVQLEIDEAVHNQIKEYARRQRIMVGVAYERAILTFLKMPENSMGQNNQQIINRLSKGIK